MNPKTNIILHSDSAPSLPALAPPLHGVEPPDPTLSPEQHLAISLLIEGLRSGKVAEKVGVDRATLYRWRTYDPNFVAEMNRWRGQVLTDTRDRVHAITAKAADSVEQAIDAGNSALSLRIMDKMGCLKPGPVYPVDPYAVWGISPDDEKSRRPVHEGFQQVSRFMTDEQRRRAPQFVAIGIVYENRLAGRPTPPGLLEMAGLPPDAPLPSASGSTDEGPPGEKAVHPEALPVKVKARVIPHRDKGGGGLWRILPWRR